jgi:two-component system, cell cycle sensor histidine kinase and response regulator CckA
MRVIPNPALIEFSGGLAHELANIFTAAAGNLSLLDDDCRSSASCGQTLNDIRRTTVRGFDLITLLRAFAGRQALRETPVDANGVAERALEEARASLASNITAKLLPSPEKCTVVADDEKLRSAIGALIVNAHEAMPKGGQLTVVVTIEPGEDRKDYVRIAVRDTGVGMKPGFAAHACEPLVTTKPRAFRNGWGLATCDGIVRQSGGFLELDSIPGKGTKASLVLPLAD